MPEKAKHRFIIHVTVALFILIVNVFVRWWELSLLKGDSISLQQFLVAVVWHLAPFGKAISEMSHIKWNLIFLLSAHHHLYHCRWNSLPYPPPAPHHNMVQLWQRWCRRRRCRTDSSFLNSDISLIWPALLIVTSLSSKRCREGILISMVGRCGAIPYQRHCHFRRLNRNVIISTTKPGIYGL